MCAWHRVGGSASDRESKTWSCAQRAHSLTASDHKVSTQSVFPCGESVCFTEHLLHAAFPRERSGHPGKALGRKVDPDVSEGQRGILVHRKEHEQTPGGCNMDCVDGTK